MKLADIISAWLSKAANRKIDLKTLLENLKIAAPDLGPEIDVFLAALDAPVDVAGVATAVIPELGNIALFKFDGRDHPADAF